MGRPRRKTPVTAKPRRFRPLRVLLLISLGFVFGFGVPYLWWLNRLLVQEMTAAHWQAPARVYARSMRLKQGMPLDPPVLTEELRLSGYQPGDGLDPGTYSLEGSRLRVAGRGILPGSAKRLEMIIERGRLTRLSGGDRLEPMMIGTVYGSRDRIPVALADVPAALVLGLQAVEDRQFKHHHGVSPRAILRAIWANLRSGAIVQGGSTLSQQLVKTLFLTRDRRWLRKLHEAVLAGMMEAYYGKDQILEAYLNEVFLGQHGHRAINGVGQAAEFYFGRPLQQLDLRRQALLVGLLKGPSYYNPWRHPQRALERRNRVLRAMYETGVISRSVLLATRSQPLGVLRNPGGQSGQFPAFMGLVRQQLARTMGDAGSSGGWQIESGLSLRHQRAAESALVKVLDQVEKDRGLAPNSLEGAVLVLDRLDGSVLAAVGGRDTDFAGFNRVRDARRPIGSLVKPFVYLTALAQGDYQLSSRLVDEPFSLPLEDGEIWSPQNFDRSSHGPVRLIDALAHSYNQATARVGLAVGLGPVIKTLVDLGLNHRPDSNPALLLGALDLSPLDVGQLYLSLANGGRRSTIHAVRRVIDRQGVLRFLSPEASQTGTSPDAWLIRFALQRAVSAGTGRSLAGRLGDSSGLAGKTGTSNANRDSWFVGFSDDLVVVVWVGRDDNQTAGITGATAALPVFARLMATTGFRPLSDDRPGDVIFHWIDGDGLLADEYCTERDYLPFRSGNEPGEWAECARPKRRWWPFSN